MTVKKFAQKLDMRVLTGEAGLEKKVTGMYVCDLLSWAMSKASKGEAWVTVQNHVNTVAVALLTEVSCIILPENIEAEEATLKKAVHEGIAVLSTSMTAYDVCWKTSRIL